MLVAALFWLIAFGAIPTVANETVRDHELGTMDMLRMTYLRPRSIILGQAASATASLLPLIAFGGIVLFPIFVSAIFDRAFPVSLLVAALVTGVMGYLMILALAQAAAMCSRRSSVGMPVAFVAIGTFTLIAFVVPGYYPGEIYGLRGIFMPFGPLIYTQGLAGNVSFLQNALILAEGTTSTRSSDWGTALSTTGRNSWIIIWTCNIVFSTLVITASLAVSKLLFHRIHWRDR